MQKNQSVQSRKIMKPIPGLTLMHQELAYQYIGNPGAKVEMKQRYRQRKHIVLAGHVAERPQRTPECLCQEQISRCCAEEFDILGRKKQWKSPTPGFLVTFSVMELCMRIVIM